MKNDCSIWKAVGRGVANAVPWVGEYFAFRPTWDDPTAFLACSFFRHYALFLSVLTPAPVCALPYLGLTAIVTAYSIKRIREDLEESHTIDSKISDGSGKH